MSKGSFRDKVEALKRKKMANKKVVDLSDFRESSELVEQPKILVVDDDALIRHALERILASRHYQVLTAEDGLELAQVLENTSPDMILLDVNLPWVDGFELCELIKSQQSCAHLPIVLVSARSSEEDINQGIAAGADDYIVKPINFERVISVVDKFLSSEQ